MGAAIGLGVYLAAVYAAVPRPGPGGGGDRAPGIVLARYRQVQLDVMADERPFPRPSLSAVPPATVPAALVQELSGVARGGDDATDLASRPTSPSRPRSPPVV